MLAILIGLIAGFGIGFLINAGLVWIICWALKAVGITTIFGWTVAFSWPLVILFTIIYMIISGIFKLSVKVK